MFEADLEEFIAPEMPDAEIERAFQAALAEWRRTAPQRAEAERKRLAETERRVRERSVTSVSAPSAEAMIDPARAFQDNTDAGKT
ncbi:hypothetical protein MKK63_30815 [Methylobacterium sp. J-088]|nr:hypothetical protein [Methylobacterium sp. J-088]